MILPAGAQKISSPGDEPPRGEMIHRDTQPGRLKERKARAGESGIEDAVHCEKAEGADRPFGKLKIVHELNDDRDAPPEKDDHPGTSAGRFFALGVLRRSPKTDSS